MKKKMEEKKYWSVNYQDRTIKLYGGVVGVEQKDGVRITYWKMSIDELLEIARGISLDKKVMGDSYLPNLW